MSACSGLASLRVEPSAALRTHRCLRAPRVKLTTDPVLGTIDLMVIVPMGWSALHAGGSIGPLGYAFFPAPRGPQLISEFQK